MEMKPGPDSIANVMQAQLSRRNLMRSAGLMGLVAASPMPLLAHGIQDHAFPITTAELARYVADGQLAGTLAAIGFGLNEPKYIGAGFQSLAKEKPVDQDTLWRIYSMTKPITGMAAMMLIEDGKMTLDTPLADILPAFANMQVQLTPDGSITELKPAKAKITIRHLLTHTAGFGYSIIQKGPIKDAYIDAGVVPGQVSRMAFPGMDRGEPANSLEEFADNLATLPLVYEPGTQWSYSVSLDLMGRVIEVVSGKPFDVFLQERMFDPLGMSSTWFRVPESEVGRLSTNYAPFNGLLIPLDPAKTSIYLDTPKFPYGGAGLVCSAHDYDRFLMMLLGKGALEGVRVMEEKTALTGMSNLLPEGAKVTGGWVEGQGFGAGGRVGLGTDKGPKGTYGWGGAAGTAAFVDNVRGFRAAGYAQYMPADSYPFQGDFPKLIYQDLMAG